MESRSAGEHPARRALVTARAQCFADFTPLAELHELRCAVYLGDGKEVPLRGVPQGADPVGAGDLVHGRRFVQSALEGVQQRTIGGSGRIEICVEAMSEGSRVRLRDYLRDTHGLDVRLRHAGAAGKAVLVFSTAATAKFQELMAPYMASVHGVQAAAALPWPVRGGTAVRRTHDATDACARITEIESKPDTDHEPLRYRGRGFAQLLRRRGHGAQLA